MIITQTPLRISLLGGGTDFEEYYSHRPGLVVSSAIDKFVYVIIKERYDDLIYINYSKKEIVHSVQEIQHELVREAMLQTGVEKGVEITMLADIPSEGSGLGSSSSILVGLLNALYLYAGSQVTAELLAHQSAQIEILRCRKPIGKQDHYIAAFGGLCSIQFLGSGEVLVERHRLTDKQRRELDSNLLLFFTGTTRQSSEILAEQQSKTATRLAELDMIRSLAVDAQRAVKEGEFGLIGPLLHKNWEFKKKLASRITSPEIDRMYERARSAGATGGKIAGAGGGGFLLLYCPHEKQQEVREALKEYREMPFLFEVDGSKAIFNYRRYGWK